MKSQTLQLEQFVEEAAGVRTTVVVITALIFGCMTEADPPGPEGSDEDEELIDSIDDDGESYDGTNEGASGAGIEAPTIDLVFAGCLKVNGRCLNAREAKWVRVIATQVVPELAGNRYDRIVKASRVAWWALKEGLLDTTNPPAFSLCGYSNTRLGPTDLCGSGLPWQVGLSGIQVTYLSHEAVEAKARARFPGKTIPQILADAARDAGYGPDTAIGREIASSTGTKRKSWLLRESVVGTELQHRIVYGECIASTRSWCYTTAWWPSSSFSPNRTAALRSLQDMRRILDRLAP